MRRWCAVIVVLAPAVLLPACQEEQRRPVGQPLVLELGGDGRTIAEVLRRTRGEPERRAEAEEPVDEPQPLIAERRPEPREVPQPPRSVRLPEGWTLIRLCEQHLGDRERWTEVAQLNGWSEAELRRLPAGTVVRLPER